MEPAKSDLHTLKLRPPGGEKNPTDERHGHAGAARGSDVPAPPGTGSIDAYVNASGTDRIPRRPENGAIPLSSSQTRLWFLHQLEPDSPIYNRPVVLSLSGTLRIDVLGRALNEIVRRHDVLRTSFPVEDGRPRQHVTSDLPVTIARLDVSDLPLEERRKRSRDALRDEACRAFDLAAGPLIRFLLIRHADRHHTLLTTIHHTAFDGWSSQIFFRELAELYDAFESGTPASLPDLPIQYADFAAWQQQGLNRPDLEKQMAYWRDRLADIPAVDLSRGRRGPAHLTAPGGRQRVRIRRPLSEAIRSLARTERATPFMVLLAAFKLMLQRYSGQDDVAVGCPVAGRRRTETEVLIGCFTNTLVLRSDLSGRPTFRELLARVRATTVGALSNQDVPFEHVVEDLRPDRSLSHTPFFQILFQLRNYPRYDHTPGGLTIEESTLDMEATGLDLTMELGQDQDGFSGWLIYNRDVFPSDSVAHMIEQFDALLRQIVQEPHRSIDEYSLITGGAETLLPDPTLPLAEPKYETVIERLRTCTMRGPEQIAVEHGGRAWTYEELEERVDELARGLVAEGLHRGEPVGILGPRSFGVTVGMLAVLAAGGVIVPISEDLPIERRLAMLREARASMLLYAVAAEQHADAAPYDDHHLILIDPLTAARIGAPTARSGIHAPSSLPEVGPEDPAYIFFTSGTTGRPKGVLGVHKGLGHFLAWQRDTFAVGPGDRCAHLTALSFDVILRDMFLPLSSGAALCIPPENLDPFDVLDWLASQQVTVAHVVPSVVRTWLSQASPPPRIPSLRLVFSAGEALTDELVHAWRNALDYDGEIVNLYGPTETTLAKCFFRVPGVVSPGIQPVGQALPHSQALVLGPGDRRCGVNEPGEVVLRTPFRTRGYLDDPDERRRSFFGNPFRDDPGDLLYRTGDAGHYGPDGLLTVSGRLDDQVKIRGVRIEPGEVAAVISRHDNVESAVVLARKNEGSDATLIAYVVPRSRALSAATLRANLSARLPAAMIPTAYVFLDALPLTPNGKIDRSMLPEPDASAELRAYAPPRTPLEKIIVEILSEVLGLEQIGIDDDFFELGGHSLLIMRIASRMRERLGVYVSVHQFFETPTVALLAATVQPGSDESAVGLIQDLLDDLDGLSDDEVQQLLGGEDARASW